MTETEADQKAHNDYFQEANWIALIFVLAAFAIVYVLYKVFDFIMPQKPTGHFRDILISIGIGLVASVWIVVTILYLAS